MNWSFIFFFNSILLGAGLAMDAFSVSMANGLNDPKMSKKRMLCIAGTFAAFQAFMPMTGWICVHTIVEYFSAFEKFIPWIALILLALFGKFFGHSREVYVSTLVLTLVGAVYDLLRNLPENLRALLHLDGLIEAVGNVLPLSGIGFGWVCPAIIGLAIGLLLHFSRRKKATA